MFENMPPEIKEVVSQELMKHIAIHGDGLRTHTKEITACHESGHIIVGHFFNFYPTNAWIKEEYKEIWTGYTQYGKPHGEINIPTEPEKVILEIFCNMAGHIAEYVLCNINDQTSSFDERLKVLQLAQTLEYQFGYNHSKVLEKCSNNVIALINYYKPYSLSLAKKLKSKKSLSTKDIYEVLKDVPVQEDRYEIARWIIQEIKS